ncbi:MAG: hypothetical protein U9N33_11440 [Campylobacterota bacterium]|nr:hypothetical protein [Campylobacterota bacterium]
MSTLRGTSTFTTAMCTTTTLRPLTIMLGVLETDSDLIFARSNVYMLMYTLDKNIVLTL